VSAIVYTIGHSTHRIERFLELLHSHGITALGDVRSNPHSRYNPQFNRETLKASVTAASIAYVFLGRELGARSDDPSCYVEGKVQYDRLARTELFQQGLDRVAAGAARYQLALMCAEKEPLGCHRTILVAPALEARGFAVRHILADGGMETHADTMARLLRQLNLPASDMFRTPEETLADAYRLHGARIAYQK